MIGTKLAHYEITGHLGTGGMGEVYQATDSKLGRSVAIKFLPAAFASDPDRLARFRREAQLLASLNHPNIAHIYGLEESGDTRCIVMELIEGETLQARIKNGKIPVDEALKIAKQIVDALEAAHEKSVIHRDLKPGNVMLTADGRVKVLDFGLAKAYDANPLSTTSSNSPTMASMAATNAGVILGTASYMSPEQARGKNVDRRADIWAFGAVLFEMLAGQRAFPGEDLTDTLASVVKMEPKWDVIPEVVPSRVRQVLRLCLQKDPRQRVQAIGDVRLALDGAFEATAPQTAAALTPARSRWLVLAAALIALVLGAGVTAWLMWPKPPLPQHVTRFQVRLPDKVIYNSYVSISPDGHKLVFSATGEQSGLWIHNLDTLEWRRLPGTDGGESPFWSPDSLFLGFRMGNQLKKIEVSGGPVQTLCSVPNNLGTGAWSRNGVIVFGSRNVGPMYRVSDAGGIPTVLTAPDGSRGDYLDGLPSFLPDGKHFLYLQRGLPEVSGIYVGSVDAKPAEQSKERILATMMGASYIDGRLLFMNESTLMVQPFDAGNLKMSGSPVPVVERVGNIQGAVGLFSASSSDVLVYRTGAAAEYQATWFDRQGKVAGTFGKPGSDQGFTLSPDAKHALVRDARQLQSGDLWRLDFESGVRSRVTIRQSLGSFAVWSPDGNSIIFAAGNTMDTLFRKASSGAGEEKELFKKTGEIKYPTSWSRDARWLLYSTPATLKSGSDVWLLPLEGDRKPVLLLGDPFDESVGSFSPDMRWIAYGSNESGRPEIFVRPFKSSGPSGPALGEGKSQISKDGGYLPAWSAEGKEIIFHGPNGAPMAVNVNGNGAEFQHENLRQLFNAPANVGDWDVTADGKRFLMAVPLQKEAGDDAITVVLNWQAALKH